MNAQHSPGPWEFQAPNIFSLAPEKPFSWRKARVAVNWLGYKDSPTFRANGLLIAAAPDLLAAAQLAAADMDWSSGKGRAAWDALNAAIAKATGGAA
jgi:hypothetical protein